MKIIALTLNPAIDVHCTAAVFRAEHENKAVITATHAGGKGVNIVRALAAAGIEAPTVVVAGRENAPAFFAQLAAEGVRVLPLTVEGKIRENITIHPETGRETRLSFAGPTVSDEVLVAVRAALGDAVNKDLILTVTGSHPQGLTMPAMQAFLAALRDAGVRMVIDSGAFGAEDLIEAKPFLIKPNEEEIAAYLGKDEATTEDVLRFAREMHRNGIENVMVSLGGRGAYLVCGEGAFFAAAPRIEVVSTIGAGDSSIAGFLAAFTAGKAAAACLAAAVAFGSAACLTEGTKPPRAADIARLSRGITARKL